MRVLVLEIYGFRGICRARLVLANQSALVGPNGSGKSTIVDALSLVFGRSKLVRGLTEHDFYGSCPRPEDRIRIVATLGGFPSNNPAENPQWFRQDRAVEKWWDPAALSVVAVRSSPQSELCVQIGYAARFDHEELIVEEKRYFHDDDEIIDPFMDEAVTPFPYKLLRQIGFFVLPVGRTWPSTISFGSEIFRKAVATLGGVPAHSVLMQRDVLRNPDSPLENDPQIKPLIDGINGRMAQLMPGTPKLQLRLTSTDSESVLQALVPHFTRDDQGVSLPVGRHGTGMLSLQTLVLLLEIGRARKQKGESFFLALEEPEMHVPPGLQRRLIGEAARVSDQVICTTHAPRVASFFDARSIQILSKRFSMGVDGEQSQTLEGRPLAPSAMIDVPNPLIQLYTDDRARLVEALMFPAVLVPEGRTDFEWLRLLLDVSETGERPLHESASSTPPFGSVVGVVPTRTSAIKVTFERLRELHPAVMALVDGDPAGDDYVADLTNCESPPIAILQWQENWTIEDVIAWILAADNEGKLLRAIQDRLSNRSFSSLTELVAALKSDDGRVGGLKTHYMAHEEIAGVMKGSALCVRRVELLLEAVTGAALTDDRQFAHLKVDHRTTHRTRVYRFNS